MDRSNASGNHLRARYVPSALYQSSDRWIRVHTTMSCHVLIDFETNGCRGGVPVDHADHRVVQFAAITLRSSRSTGQPLEFSCVVKPETEAGMVYIPRASTAIHGITNERVAETGPNGPKTFAHAWLLFKEWLPSNVDALVAHNMGGFDGKVLEKELRLCGLWHGGDALLHKGKRMALCDTLPAFREALPHLSVAAAPGTSPYSLGSLFLHATGRGFDMHNAASDVVALREVMLAYPRVAPRPVGGSTPLPLDGEMLTALRYVGCTRAVRLRDHLESCNHSVGDTKTIKALRVYAKHFGIFALEKTLREQIGVFSDDHVVSIVQEVTGVHARPTIGYYQFYNRNPFSQTTRAKLRAADIRTRDELRWVFMYTCKEDTAAFEELLQQRAGLTEAQAKRVATVVAKDAAPTGTV